MAEVEVAAAEDQAAPVVGEAEEDLVDQAVEAEAALVEEVAGEARVEAVEEVQVEAARAVEEAVVVALEEEVEAEALEEEVVAEALEEEVVEEAQGAEVTAAIRAMPRVPPLAKVQLEDLPPPPQWQARLWQWQQLVERYVWRNHRHCEISLNSQHTFIPTCLQTKVVAVDHSLKGILNKRMSLFSNIAQHSQAERPPRRGEIEATSYRLQTDSTIVAPV